MCFVFSLFQFILFTAQLHSVLFIRIMFSFCLHTSMNKTQLISCLLGLGLSANLLAQESENIAQYLQEQGQQHSLEDHYASSVPDELNLDAQRSELKWREEGKPDHCYHTKNKAEVTTDFDYGEANDLSDGLHHIDLPPVHTRNNKSSHRVYANNPHLLPGNQQFAAPSEGSFGFSVSSDCL
ncbi:DNA-directed RNA polymerase subunit beta [Vibrio parahaemolyticus]|nr:DNA-directed RNA polymerase subunit beta [Vibrio parahaemolyticus]